eukprot:Hpha_TRINITY_DN15498_c2_g7::TRINITY_DN15498_c2_g7_i1::g.173072::m.173072
MANRRGQAALEAHQKRNKDGDVIIPDSNSVYYSEDGTASIVLDDNFDPGYEPSQKEVTEYAQWLGMDPDDDEPLMWIAKEGLRAPLPDHWRPCKTDNGEIYYFNFSTGDSIWDHPMDEHYKKLYQEENKKRREGKPFKRGPDESTQPPGCKMKPKGGAAGGAAGGKKEKKEKGLDGPLGNALEKRAPSKREDNNAIDAPAAGGGGGGGGG